MNRRWGLREMRARWRAASNGIKDWSGQESVEGVGWESRGGGEGGAESSLRHRLAIDETVYIHGTQILC